VPSHERSLCSVLNGHCGALAQNIDAKMADNSAVGANFAPKFEIENFF
jgi:hypothetical protein